MNLISLPVLKDNYVWILHNYKECLIIDPGESLPVLNFINKFNLIPVAILVTHHHADHVKGIFKLLEYFNIPVYGPKETIKLGTTKIVNNKKTITLLNHEFHVISLSGHTLEHVGYYSKPWLFSGDTIFSAGCGQVFEDRYEQMYESILKIKKFPINTIICPSHEYTLKNLIFANQILPECSFIKCYLNRIKYLRYLNYSSLPTTLYIENYINLFLRCHDLKLNQLFKINFTNKIDKELQIFKILRKKRNDFINTKI